MTNTLYLPELREMLAESNTAELHEFCIALHPARTAEFMEGLTAAESWAVLQQADDETRAQIFGYFDRARQVEIIESADRRAIGQLIASLPADDRVDILHSVAPQIVEELLPLIPATERRDILRLRAYPEGTAGAMMTTEFARLGEGLTARAALDALARQAEGLETIYYVFIVDEEDHLRGLISARQLLSGLGKPDALVDDLMERAIVTVEVDDDQEQVAAKVAKYDLHAIPVIDRERRLVGIITHDDVIDVVRQEATEDAQMIGAVAPLRTSYLHSPLLTLTWKRGLWLTILFLGAIGTIFTLRNFDAALIAVPWLVFFLPLVISTGGNSGSQSATLIITALSTGDITLQDWFRVVRRELAMGFLLGGLLALIAAGLTALTAPHWLAVLILPLTILLVVLCGTLTGSLLPLLFRRLGLDPAMMSNPFVACICDLLGTLIYLQVALWLMNRL
jgi:magnesium transporter